MKNLSLTLAIISAFASGSAGAKELQCQPNPAGAVEVKNKIPYDAAGRMIPHAYFLIGHKWRLCVDPAQTGWMCPVDLFQYCQ